MNIAEIRKQLYFNRGQTHNYLLKQVKNPENYSLFHNNVFIYKGLFLKFDLDVNTN